MSPSITAEQVAANRIKLSIAPSPGFAKFRMSSDTARKLQDHKFNVRAPINDFVDLMTNLSGEQGIHDVELDDGNVLIRLEQDFDWEAIRHNVVATIARYLNTPPEDVQVGFVPLHES